MSITRVTGPSEVSCQHNPQHEAQLLPFSVETCGAMAPDAVKLLQLVSTAGREHLGLWPHEDTMRHVLGAIAMAVQRGNAMALLAGYSKAVMCASAAVDRE